MRFYALFIILCISQLACSDKNISRFEIIDNTLSASASNIEATMNKERSSLIFSSGKVVKNCTDYLTFNKSDKLEEFLLNQQVKSEYLECDVLNVLRKSKAFTDESKDLQFDRELAYRLDLRSFPNSLRPALTNKSYTLHSLFEEKINLNGNEVTYEDEEWYLSLKVVAVVNANENLSQDWVVWMIDQAKNGNYVKYESLIVYDPLTFQNEFTADTLIK